MNAFQKDIYIWHTILAEFSNIYGAIMHDCGAIVARLWRDCGAILDNYGAVTKTQPILIFDLFLVKICKF